MRYQDALSESPGQATLPPVDIIVEEHGCHLQFNVMANRPVTEVLHFHRYEVSADYVRGEFDRTYASTMLASPSHLIFLSALVHAQKLFYMLLCKRWGFPYEAHGAERLKIWPTRVDVKIPELITEERNLVQELWLRELREVRKDRYRFVAEVRVSSTVMEISGVAFPI